MIGEIEGVEAEGQELILKSLESLLQARVEVCRARTVDEVAVLLRGEGSRGRRRKDIASVSILRVEPRIGIVANREFAVTTDVRPGSDLKELSLETGSDTGDVLAGCDVEGGSRLELIGLRELPATKRLVGKTAVAAEGDFVDGVQDEDLAEIVVCRSAESFGVVGVGQEVLLEGAAVT